MSYPRVLIIGETFRNNGGGGITMMNLFKNWPAEDLAVITELIDECSPTYHCKKYYRIGHLEKKIVFPFGLFKKRTLSGEVEVTDGFSMQLGQPVFTKSLRSTLKAVYNKTLQLLGLYHFINRIALSDELLDWVNNYSPELIYHQPFKYSDMKLALQLKSATNLPLTIHVMDDIVSFANKPNLLYFYWNFRVSQLFNQLIKSASVCLSISEYMSDEYFRRYGRIFLPFRNPIELDEWMPHVKTHWSIGKTVKIIYTGRLAVPNIKTLTAICFAINNLRERNYDIALDIYSLDNNMAFYRKIEKLNGINIKSPVHYKTIPGLLPKYDIAILPIDFNRRGIKFAKYSISTKTSEYLISGVPVFLLSPPETALSYYAIKTNSMFISHDKSIESIEEKLMTLIDSEDLRKNLAKTAINVATNDSEATGVRRAFRSALLSVQLMDTINEA